VSLFGRLTLERSYYHCVKCGWSDRPWDRTLGLTRRGVTPAAARVICQAGVLASFADAALDQLPTMCGLRLSESTVERVCEAEGERVARRLAAGETAGPSSSWAWERDALGHTVAYVGIDHTGVPQQGPGGRRADHRMAAVGTVYNPQSEHDDARDVAPRTDSTTARPAEPATESPVPPPVPSAPKSRKKSRAKSRTALQAETRRARFIAGFYSLEDFGRALRREAEAVGVMQADVQIALSDGGAGLEATLKHFFPNAVCIIDFWHAKEHLVELAKALWPADAEARQGWLHQQCHRLKHSGGAAVLKELKSLDVTDRTAAVQELHRQQVGYFENHAHRMDYPTYVANGWQIGSGPVEAACKQVVSRRLKSGGMRWSEPGSAALCHLRALYLSDRACWNSHWASNAADHLQI